MTRGNDVHQQRGSKFGDAARNMTGLWIDDATGRVVDSVRSESRNCPTRESRRQNEPPTLTPWPASSRMAVTSRKKSIDLVGEEHRQAIPSGASPSPLLPPRRVLLLEKRGRR
jgi:hypothetical protein